MADLNTIPIDITKAEHSKIGNVDFDNLSFGQVFTDHMFVCDFEDGKWQNPRITPYQSISLEPSAKIFHYGQSIFEGMKAYKDGNDNVFLFRPIDNFNRLNISAKRLAMPELPEAIFMEGLKELDPVAYVRFASVYRNFREEKDFVQFVDKLDVYKKR